MRDAEIQQHCIASACMQPSLCSRCIEHKQKAHVIRAIAVMHIEVEYHDPLQTVPLLGILRSDGDRVEQAEPHRTLPQAHELFHARCKLRRLHSACDAAMSDRMAENVLP